MSDHGPGPPFPAQEGGDLSPGRRLPNKAPLCGSLRAFQSRPSSPESPAAAPPHKDLWALPQLGGEQMGWGEYERTPQLPLPPYPLPDAGLRGDLGSVVCWPTGGDVVTRDSGTRRLDRVRPPLGMASPECPGWSAALLPGGHSRCFCFRPTLQVQRHPEVCVSPLQRGPFPAFTGAQESADTWSHGGLRPPRPGPPTGAVGRAQEAVLHHLPVLVGWLCSH